MRGISLLLLFSGLLLGACAGDSDDNPADEKSVYAFKANPQRVDEQPVSTLAIGAAAPDFRLPGVDGKYYSLADFADKQVLVIVFTCNHCPTAQAYEERLIQVHEDYAGRGVGLVAISPNSPVGLLYEELGYTDLGDSYEDMVIRAGDRRFPFTYLYDGDDHKASIPYGPVATPHVFVFDRDRKLQYAGRVDGSEKPGTGNAEDLRAAIDAVLAGKPVANPVTKTFGCSVKWAWKDDYKAKVNAEWAAEPVALQDIDAKGLRDLVRNEGSGKLRLINVWATWCGPCVIEYPDLVATHRMYKGRDFEFVSVSADKAEAAGKALEFLKSKESAVKNYRYAGNDNDAMIAALDSSWSGALPYTLLVEPGGKVVYRHEGAVDLLKLRKAIVDHPMIGRYY